MLSIVFGFFAVLGCYDLGQPLLKRLKLTLDADERFVLSTSLGLGILGFIVLGFGLLGFFSTASLNILLVGLILLFIIQAKSLQQTFTQFKKDLSGIPAISLWLLAALFTVSVVTALAGVLVPETTNDSLCYHLHLPQKYLADQRFQGYPYEINAYFPFLMEMLYTLGLASGGVGMAKFFHFATGLLAMLGIFVFAKKRTGTEAAALAAVIFFTVPGIFNQLGTTYVDAGLSLFVLLATVSFLKWRGNAQSNWLILSGIFLGFALGIKFLALIPVLILVLFLVTDSIKQKSNLARNLFSFCFPLIAVGSFWYIRSWIATGNPVFPYFYSVFQSGDPSIHYDDIGLKRTLWNFLAAPWIMTFSPQQFEGFGVQMGPAFLAFLVPAFLGKKFHNRGFYGIFGLLFLAFWFMLGQSLRFFFPALAVLSLTVAHGIHSFDGRPRRLAMIAATGVIAIQTLIGVYHYRHDFIAAFGKETDDAYLVRRERSYGPAKYINQNVPLDAKILAADEVHLYYFKRSIVRESVYAFSTGYDKQANKAEDVINRLKRDGFTHILRAETPAVPPLVPPARFRVPALVQTGQNQLADYLEPLYNHQFADEKGTKTLYSLYKIK